MAKKKGIGVNSVILIIVVVLVVGLSLGVFFKAPVGEAGEGELAQMIDMGADSGDGDDEMPDGDRADGGDKDFCKDDSKPYPCFVGGPPTKPICCNKPHCETSIVNPDKIYCEGTELRCRSGGGIRCNGECCEGFCFKYKKNKRGMELCCGVNSNNRETYPVKNEKTGIYECREYCMPGEKYNKIKKKCEVKCTEDYMNNEKGRRACTADEINDAIKKEYKIEPHKVYLSVFETFSGYKIFRMRESTMNRFPEYSSKNRTAAESWITTYRSVLLKQAGDRFPTIFIGNIFILDYLGPYVDGEYDPKNRYIDLKFDRPALPVSYICDVCTRNLNSKKYPFSYCSVMMKIGTGISWSCIGDRT